jgi:hypothetical protein
MTPEIRWLLILAALFALVACLIEASHVSAERSAWDVLVGPVKNFTTRRIPAVEFLER